MKRLATVLCITLAGLLFGVSAVSAEEAPLGELDQLVYNSVQPCRIVDTRAAVGMFGANEARTYITYGNVTAQNGGAPYPNSCPAPKGEPRAVHINVTAVPGSSQGNLRAYPAAGPLPSASLVNFRPNQNIANAANIFTTFGTPAAPDIQVFASASTHVVIDVMGYFYDVEDVFISEGYQDFGGGAEFDPIAQVGFLVQPAQVVVTRPNQNIFVISSKAFGTVDNTGADGLRLNICYDGPGSTNPVPVGAWVPGIEVDVDNQDARLLQTLSALIVDLAPPAFPATYDVGLCGNDPGADAGADWNNNGRGMTTAFVVEDKQP